MSSIGPLGGIVLLPNSYLFFPVISIFEWKGKNRDHLIIGSLLTSRYSNAGTKLAQKHLHNFDPLQMPKIPRAISFMARDPGGQKLK